MIQIVHLFHIRIIQKKYNNNNNSIIWINNKIKNAIKKILYRDFLTLNCKNTEALMLQFIN